MTMIAPATSRRPTVEDLLHRLGDIPAGRVLLDPPPGRATQADLLRIYASERRLCELVEGTLVEKAMGFRESYIAIVIATALQNFVRPRNLGPVTGADGMLRLARGLVRIPDVAFISWDRLPGGRMPRSPIPSLAPDLAVEVISAGNTEREMDRKRDEYLAGGTRLLWLVDPESRTVTVCTGAGRPRVLGMADTLTGGKVLPGFSMPVAEVFAEPRAGR